MMSGLDLKFKSTENTKILASLDAGGRTNSLDLHSSMPDKQIHIHLDTSTHSEQDDRPRVLLLEVPLSRSDDTYLQVEGDGEEEDPKALENEEKKMWKTRMSAKLINFDLIFQILIFLVFQILVFQNLIFRILIFRLYVN